MSGRVLTGHQAGPTGSAIGSRRIGVHKDHSFFRQLVHVRALVVFRPHETEVGPPHVVDEEENDVGLGRQAGRKQGQQESEECFFHERTTKNGNNAMVKPVSPNPVIIRRARYA